MLKKKKQIKIGYCYDDDDIHSVNILGNQNDTFILLGLSNQHRPSAIIPCIVFTALVSSQKSFSCIYDMVTNALPDEDTRLRMAV